MPMEVWLGVALAVIFCLYIYTLMTSHKWRKQRQRQSQEQTCADSKIIPYVRPRLPVVGNAWTLHRRSLKFHLALTEWAKEYGPVYRLKLYNEEILVLNDFDSIHDALVVKGSDFAGRPAMSRTLLDGRHEHSIVWQTFNDKLQFLRKEVLRSFKFHGDGLESLEHKCRPEIESMLEKMGGHGTEAFDPWGHVYDAVSNIMLDLTLNQRFDCLDERFQELKDFNRLFNEVFGSGNARNLDYLPWLWNLRHYAHYKKLKAALHLRDQFWSKELSRLKAKGFTQCIVQRFLSLTSSSDGGVYGIEEKTAKEVFTNLILAGTDTTATALTSLLLVFLHKPEVQERMWEEITSCHQSRVSTDTGNATTTDTISTTGTNTATTTASATSDRDEDDQPITLSDRRLLPYCQAVLLELLRFVSHVPLAVPHATIRDTTVLNAHVAKDTTVYINLWSLHHSEEHWDRPWDFVPERFLDDTTGQVVSPSHPARRRLMAFGAGRRVCLGEVLAKNRLFLFATALVQRFQFLPRKQQGRVEGEEGQGEAKLPPLDPRNFEMGLVIHPPPFQLSVRPRRPRPSVDASP